MKKSILILLLILIAQLGFGQAKASINLGAQYISGGFEFTLFNQLSIR